MFLTKEQYDEEQKYWHDRFTKNCSICNGHGNLYNNETKSYKFCECVDKTFLYVGLSVGRIPKKFIDWEWSWCHDTPYVRECRKYSDGYLANLSGGRHLYLFGVNGKGKTTIETILAKEIMRKINPRTKKHFTVAFFMFDEIVTLFYQRNSVKSAELLDRIINWPNVLIIDNLGSEVGFDNDSKFNVKVLESVLRRRDNVADSTNIISSNLNLEELAKHYGSAIAQAVSRSYECINFNKEFNSVDEGVNEFIEEVPIINHNITVDKINVTIDNEVSGEIKLEITDIDDEKLPTPEGENDMINDKTLNLPKTKKSKKKNTGEVRKKRIKQNDEVHVGGE